MAAVIAVIAGGFIGLDFVSRAWAFGFSGELHSGSRTSSAAGITGVVVSADLGRVQVHTGAHEIRAQWRTTSGSAHPLNVRVTGQTLYLRFANGSVPFWSAAHVRKVFLNIEIPAGLRLDLRVGVGEASVAGVYTKASAVVATGDLNISEFMGGLSGDVQVGQLTVRSAKVEGLLHLKDNTGSISFTGDPGTGGVVQSGVGSIKLHMGPKGRLKVRAQVGVGDITYGYSGLSSGGERYVGEGPLLGKLSVSDGVGSIYIGPNSR